MAAPFWMHGAVVDFSYGCEEKSEEEDYCEESRDTESSSEKVSEETSLSEEETSFAEKDGGETGCQACRKNCPAA
jgi:hypothetical protein